MSIRISAHKPCYPRSIKVKSDKFQVIPQYIKESKEEEDRREKRKKRGEREFTHTAHR